MTAKTSSRWIKLPPICTRNPTNQKTTRMATIAQSKPTICFHLSLSIVINLMMVLPSTSYGVQFHHPAERAGKAAEQREEAIVVDNFSKSYDSRRVVNQLHFTVYRREVFALLGPNGAGKTTTVETLEGYRTPDEGTIRVLGLDP